MAKSILLNKSFNINEIRRPIAAVRPVVTYGVERSKKQQSDKLYATEMAMLRWDGGVTASDHIRDSFRIIPIQRN